MNYSEEFISNAVSSVFKRINNTKIIKVICHVDYMVAVLYSYQTNIRVIFIDLDNYYHHGYEFWLSLNQIINHFEKNDLINLNFSFSNITYRHLIEKMIKEIYNSNIIQTIELLS